MSFIYRPSVVTCRPVFSSVYAFIFHYLSFVICLPFIVYHLLCVPSTLFSIHCSSGFLLSFVFLSSSNLTRLLFSFYLSFFYCLFSFHRHCFNVCLFFFGLFILCLWSFIFHRLTLYLSLIICLVFILCLRRLSFFVHLSVYLRLSAFRSLFFVSLSIFSPSFFLASFIVWFSGPTCISFLSSVVCPRCRSFFRRQSFFSIFLRLRVFLPFGFFLSSIACYISSPFSRLFLCLSSVVCLPPFLFLSSSVLHRLIFVVFLSLSFLLSGILPSVLF